METSQQNIEVVETDYGFAVYLPPSDNRTMVYVAMRNTKDRAGTVRLLRVGDYGREYVPVADLEFYSRESNSDWSGFSSGRVNPTIRSTVTGNPSRQIFENGSLEARAFEALLGASSEK